MTFGANTYGQLGVGDFKTYKCVCIIRGALTGKQVEKVAVGDACTIIATSGEGEFIGSFVIEIRKKRKKY